MQIDGVNIEALTLWMDTMELGQGPLSDVQALSGGTQNILVQFSRDSKTYILRRPPLHLRKNSNETMRREARILAALKDTDVPHPRLIAGCSDDTHIGACFYLMEPINGFNPAARELPEPYASNEAWQWQTGLELVEGIAKLSSVDYKSVGLHDFGKPDNFLERQVGRWASQLQSYENFKQWPGPKDIPGVGDIAAWLEDRIPKHYETGIIHGDYHLGNVMFHHDRPELAAIVDWELTTIGDPLVDLGWVMATWPINGLLSDETVGTSPWIGFPEIDDLVEHYSKHSSRDLENLNWYAVLGCYKLGIILEGTYARACAGKAPKDIGDALHARTMGLFRRAQNWID